MKIRPSTALLIFFLTITSCSQEGAASPTTNSTVPGHTKITLEINQHGKNYSVLLGVDFGNAVWNVTSKPDVNTTESFEDTPLISSANLEWYGDFDGDNEVEYLVQAFSPGAGCYLVLFAIDYDADNDEYRVFDELGFQCSTFDKLEDIEGDGKPEILGKKGGVGASAVFSPIGIFRYDGQGFVDVTREYPELIEKDAEHWLDGIITDAWGQGAHEDIFVAYLTDMYLLDRKEEGVQVFSQMCAEKLAPAPGSSWSCEGFLERIQERLEK